MLLPHRELEQVRKDMRGWLRAQRAGRFQRPGYVHITRMAIYHFHRTDSLAGTLKYLREQLDARDLKNTVQRSEAERNLRRYVRWVRSSKPAVIKCQERIRLRLDAGAQLSGEIPRLDAVVESDGYAGVLVGYGPPGWETELRMPLIQRALASSLERDEELVAVGVQNLDGNGLVLKTFGRREIDAAQREARELVATAMSQLAES